MSNLPDPTANLPLKALDIQHDTDPARDHGPARRIPHLGHAILFFSLTLFFLSLCIIILSAIFLPHATDSPAQHPGIALIAEALGYILTLAVAAQLFPRLWDRSFLHGIQWNVLAAHRCWFWIVPAAIATSALAQLAERFVHIPDNDPIARLMHTPAGAWGVTAFGVLLAPAIEEIAFRGFLLPALATAYDWLSLERTPAALNRWQTTAGHSTPAVIFAALFSSIPFALLHSNQLSHAWGAVGILYAVSLALSYVRIRTHSVACSTLMHATYNLTAFVLVFIATGGYRHLDKI
jgi:membrane protease YdiL (CAAX protease family)